MGSKHAVLIGAAAMLVAAAMLLAPTPVKLVTPDHADASATPQDPHLPAVSAPAPWVKTAPVTLSRHGSGPTVVVDSTGTATAVWQGSGARSPILAARLGPGGSWSTPVTIGHGFYPRAVVDAAGAVTVLVGTHRPGSTTGLAAVRRPADGPWGTPVALTPDRDLGGCDESERDVICGTVWADLAVNARGDVAVVWSWGVNYGAEITPFRVQAALLTDGDDWSRQAGLAEQPYPQQVVVGIDRRGRATVVYDQGRAIMARSIGPDGALTGPERVWGGHDFSEFDLAVTPDGAATVLVPRDRNPGATILAVRRPPGGAWGAPHELATGRRLDSGWIVADGSRSLTALWTTGDSGISAARWRRGSWSLPRRVAPRGAHVSWLLPVTNRAGAVAVVWPGGRWTVRAVVRAASPWSAVAVLWHLEPEMGSDFDATLGPGGRLLTVVARSGVVKARWLEPA